MELIKVSQWAVEKEFTRQNAYKIVRRHSIPFYDAQGNPDPEGHFIDRDEANRIWNASRNDAKARGGQAGGAARQEQLNLDPEDADELSQTPAPRSGDASPLGRAQLAHILLRVKEKRLTVDQMEGKLVPLASVRAFEAQAFTEVRNQLLGIGAELRDDLAAETDAVRCQALIDDRISQALTVLAAWTPDQEA
jgi:hypothetical protein